MSSEQLTAVLTSAQSADAATRKAAEEQLLAFEAQNFDAFMGLLASELGNEAKPPATRRLAGLMLKNAVFSDDCVRAAEKSAKWAAVAEGAKAQIRACLLSTLNSEVRRSWGGQPFAGRWRGARGARRRPFTRVALSAAAHAPRTQVKEARHTAAQAVGKVGALDLAAKRWPDLVPALQGNVASPSAGVKQATLEALGYVCEDLDPSALEQAQVNVVLTAVVAGMRKEEEPATREVATKALDNALVFAKKNFETDGERNYLMQMLCEGAQAPELQARSPPRACLQLPAVCLTRCRCCSSGSRGQHGVPGRHRVLLLQVPRPLHEDHLRPHCRCVCGCAQQRGCGHQGPGFLGQRVRPGA
jgi:importin subunit beta-1